VDAITSGLAPGKLADLIVVDGDPLGDIKDLYKVTGVMKGGRLYSQEQILAGFPALVAKP
jgi:imidazolonepropionase-like amidohydrolase